MNNINQHIGSSLDDLLKETGELNDVNTLAIKQVIAWELSQKMDGRTNGNQPLGIRPSA